MSRVKQDIIPKDDQGREHGQCTFYLYNGIKWWIQYFNHGQRHGLDYEFYSANGTPWNSRYWRNDVRFGSHVVYEYMPWVYPWWKKLYYKITGQL